METLLFVSRVLFALIFVVSGLNHFRNIEGMAAYTKSRGVPNARVAVILSGVTLLIGSATMLTGYWVDLGALLIFIFLIPTALLMHPYWRETDPMVRMNEQIAFLKDLSLAGGALAIFSLYQLHTLDIANQVLYGWPLFGR